LILNTLQRLYNKKPLAASWVFYDSSRKGLFLFKIKTVQRFENDIIFDAEGLRKLLISNHF
ncbi:MAG: hypothetical protein AB8G22_23520, partial [Saprospiraceae bacterium]